MLARPRTCQRSVSSLQPTAATLNRRLKAQFDPHGIFNPED